MNNLKAQNLCRHYHRGQHTVKAVDNVNFEIRQGELVAIVGSSGSGKSTILNLLAGLDKPTSGGIYYADKNLSTYSSRELSKYRAEKVGIVFQSFNLLAHKTALENTEVALYFTHTPKKNRRDLAAGILTDLGLADRLDHKPSDLSGGEQQRVAIARALVSKPEFLFADEPTGNLDQENSDQIAQLIQKLNGQGLTVIMVTHDLNLAETCARRIIKMNYGQIVDDSRIRGHNDIT